MNSNLPGTPASRAKHSPAVTNPFARALAESEQSLNRAPQVNPSNQANSLLSDALARTGGNFDFNQFPQNADGFSDNQPNYDWQAQQAEQQAEMVRKQKLDAQRRRLHDQINNPHANELFNSREKKVKEEIDKLRAELKMLAKDVGALHKEVELTLMTEVAHPGQDGKYYITFFQKLRSFIMLLRQKIKSAGTWATQMHGKGQKKRRKGSAGMMIGGQMHEKTSTVQDMTQNHERSTAYSGG